MKRKLFGAALALVLALGLSAVVRSADEGKMEKGKMEKGDLMTVACDPACGFSVSSRDEKELIRIVKVHAKTHHDKELTNEEVKAMIKPASTPAMAGDKDAKKDN